MKILFESPAFSIISTLGSKNTPKIDGVLFHSIKNATLGKKYNLSLVFIGASKAKRLNKEYRKKNYATDILSFDIDKDNGEIYIYPPKAKSKAKEFGTGVANFFNYLFVHGLAHLQGHTHEREKEALKMEKFEKIICKKFKVDVSSIHN